MLTTGSRSTIEMTGERHDGRSREKMNLCTRCSQDNRFESEEMRHENEMLITGFRLTIEMTSQYHGGGGYEKRNLCI